MMVLGLESVYHNFEDGRRSLSRLCSHEVTNVYINCNLFVFVIFVLVIGIVSFIAIHTSHSTTKKQKKIM